MNLKSRIVLALAGLGAAFCAYQLVVFLREIVGNQLPWEHSAKFTREHYVAVGEAYSRGFAVGFFLCFFLAVMALVVGTWYETVVRPRRRRAAVSLEPARVPEA